MLSRIVSNASSGSAKCVKYSLSKAGCSSRSETLTAQRERDRVTRFRRLVPSVTAISATDSCNSWLFTIETIAKHDLRRVDIRLSLVEAKCADAADLRVICRQLCPQLKAC